MLLTPPSSPVAGHLTNYMPEWETSHKVCPLASLLASFWAHLTHRVPRQVCPQECNVSHS